MLPEEWEKKLVDVNIAELTDEHIEWCDMAFISAMIVQKQSAQEIIARCKTKGKTVVVGGPVFTTSHDQFTGADHFVLNEAEVTLPMFLEDLKIGALQPIYTSEIKPDVTKTPLPMWSLINFKDYASMLVQYSRGCPFNCEFCDIIVMNGRIPRTKTPEQLTAEMQSLYDAGWRGSVFIVDDNFIGNKMNVKKMLPSLIKWQTEHEFPFKLATEASTNLADDKELMQMMSAANFYRVFLGIESPDPKSLVECSKYQNASRNLVDTVNVIHDNGMQVMGGFIVGFDNDTDSTFDAQIRFIQQVGVVTAMVGLLNALPQTRLYSRLKAEGRLLGDTTGENTDGSLNFMPKMGRERLIEGYKKIISTIYSRKQYYQRINTLIKNYKPTVKSRLTKEDFKAFVRSIWRIGVVSNSRFLYWKLVIKTLLTKARALPTAIELSICGLHFERMSAKVMNA